MIEIGTKFTLTTKGKGKTEYTVVDVEITRSMVTDKTVKIEYVCQHEFCGQKVRSRHPVVTIQRALWEGAKG